jgi:hypothetical protein
LCRNGSLSDQASLSAVKGGKQPFNEIQINVRFGSKSGQTIPYRRVRRESTTPVYGLAEPLPKQRRILAPLRPHWEGNYLAQVGGDNLFRNPKLCAYRGMPNGSKIGTFQSAWGRYTNLKNNQNEILWRNARSKRYPAWLTISLRLMSRAWRLRVWHDSHLVVFWRMAPAMHHRPVKGESLV